MSYSDNKRAIEVMIGSDNEVSVNEPARKKQKRTSIEKRQIFHNNDDETMFEELYDTITSTQIIINLNIPSCINQQIAAFAVGIVENCKTKHCNNKIILLYQDFEDNSYRSNKYYQHDGDSDFREHSFCYKCMNNTEKCNLCGILKLISNDTTSICKCKCNEKLMRYKCEECKRRKRIESIFWCECYSGLCIKCYDPQKTGKYVLCKCNYCGNNIPKSHKHCTEKVVLNEYDPTKWNFIYCAHRWCQELVCSNCDNYPTMRCNKCGRTCYFCNKHEFIEWKCSCV
eukprot:288735_1